jgi:lipooligosaccharide transport system permease protein
MSGLLRIAPLSIGSRRSVHVFERNVVIYRRQWFVFVSGFFEPLFYLLSIGLGLNHLVGSVTVDGQQVSYAAFVAPGMLATSAMNGAVIDSLYNTFWRLKVAHTYDPILATPLDVNDIAIGEALWSIARGFAYSCSFIACMAILGDTRSALVVLCLVASVLTSFAFASVGLAVCTWMRSWQDFDLIALVQLPLFLFSATFFPITVYPPLLRAFVWCSPLYQATALMRGLSLGILSWTMVINVAYLVIMGVVGLSIAARRFSAILAP